MPVNLAKLGEGCGYKTSLKSGGPHGLSKGAVSLLSGAPSIGNDSRLVVSVADRVTINLAGVPG
jgi:hypothetical protein